MQKGKNLEKKEFTGINWFISEKGRKIEHS